MATAQVPQLINYQGRLLDGTNLVNGSDANSIWAGAHESFLGGGLGNSVHSNAELVQRLEGLAARLEALETAEKRSRKSRQAGLRSIKEGRTCGLLH